MKLFKATVSSGSSLVSLDTIYVVAIDFSSAERKLLSEDNIHWTNTLNRKIINIEQIEYPVLTDIKEN